jgi:signal transduction histidine kinase
MAVRQKVTAGFVLAMAVVLGATGTFLFVQFRSELDRSLNRDLRSRADDVGALLAQADQGLGQQSGTALAPGPQRFAEVLSITGRVIDSTPGLGTPLLSSRELARATVRTLEIARSSHRVSGQPVRLLATPVKAQDRHVVVVVGTSLAERDAALAKLRTLLLIGGPGALLLAAAAGYLLIGLALRPVESMRRRARQISLSQPGHRLPVPGANDELYRLGSTLNEMLERNEVAFARESAFVADASHELRTPLSILRAELEIGLLESSSSEQLRATLASGVEETERLCDLAEDLLTLARADQGRLPIRPARVRVAETLRRVRDRFARAGEPDGRMITVSASEYLEVAADPVRLEQALMNMVENALRHGDGDTVIYASRHLGSVELHVADEGSGFPASFLPNAFRRFSRPDRSRGGEGTGLGLAIIEAIARAHGGQAHAENRPAGGAHVWVSLPDPTGGSPAVRSETDIGAGAPGEAQRGRPRSSSAAPGRA